MFQNFLEDLGGTVEHLLRFLQYINFTVTLKPFSLVTFVSDNFSHTKDFFSFFLLQNRMVDRKYDFMTPYFS